MSIFEKRPSASVESEREDNKEAIDEATVKKRGHALLKFKSKIESAFKSTENNPNESEPEGETSPTPEDVSEQLSEYEAIIGRKLDDSESTFEMAIATRDMKTSEIAEILKQKPELKGQTFRYKASISRLLAAQLSGNHHDSERLLEEIGSAAQEDTDTQLVELCTKSSFSKSEKCLAALAMNPEAVSSYLDRFAKSPQEIQELKEKHPKAAEAYLRASNIRDYCAKNTEQYGPRSLDGFGLTLLYAFHTKGLSTEDKAAFSDLIPFSEKVKVFQTLQEARQHEKKTAFFNTGWEISDLKELSSKDLSDERKRNLVIRAFVTGIARYPHNTTRHELNMSILEDILKDWNANIDLTDSGQLKDHAVKKQNLRKDLETLQSNQELKLDETDYCLLAKLNINNPPVPRGEKFVDIISGLPKEASDTIYKNWNRISQISYDNLPDEQKERVSQIVTEVTKDFIEQYQQHKLEKPDPARILTLIKEKSNDNPTIKATATALTIKTIYRHEYHRSGAVESIYAHLQQQSQENEPAKPIAETPNNTTTENQAETPTITGNTPESQDFLANLSSEQLQNISQWTELENQKNELDNQKTTLEQQRNELQNKLAEIQSQTPNASTSELTPSDMPVAPEPPKFTPGMTNEEKAAALDAYKQAELDYQNKRRQQLASTANSPRLMQDASIALQQTELYRLKNKENEIFNKLLAINRKQQALPEETKNLYERYRKLNR